MAAPSLAAVVAPGPGFRDLRMPDGRACAEDAGGLCLTAPSYGEPGMILYLLLDIGAIAMSIGCSCKAPDDEGYEACFKDRGANNHDPLPRAHLAACSAYQTLPPSINGSSR